MARPDFWGFPDQAAKISEEYSDLKKEVGEQNMKQMEKFICLRVLDMLWQEHLSYMDHIRDSVRLRAYGGRDPLVEYKMRAIRHLGNCWRLLI